jgi:hypothetical protein
MMNKQGQSGWTARRLMRLIGAAILAVVFIMALLGVFVFDVNSSPNRFFIYWTIFFLLLLSAVVIAMLDALATIGKFWGEHEKLRSDFHQELEKQSNPEQGKAETEV